MAKLNKYAVTEWRLTSLIKYSELIARMCFVQQSIHKVELEDNNKVYIIPESFYKAAILALKEVEEKEC